MIMAIMMNAQIAVAIFMFLLIRFMVLVAEYINPLLSLMTCVNFIVTVPVDIHPYPLALWPFKAQAIGCAKVGVVAFDIFKSHGLGSPR